MARKNDITPVGDGSVGLDPSITDAAAKEINKAVSENNLKWQLGRNSAIGGVYDSVLRMVQRWSAMDKINLISAYGDPSRISKSPSDDELNQALATILVAYLSKDDLKKIIGDQERISQTLSRDVKKTNAATNSKAKRYFNISNYRSQYSNAAQSAANDKQLIKGIKKGFKFSIDKIFRKEALPRLRKEIDSVLKGFTNQDLAELCVRMGIMFEDGTSAKLLRNQIINKINLYVSILLGKAKGVSHIGLTPDELSAIEDVLNLTSFAWITGSSAIGPNVLGEKKKIAMNAKKRFEAQVSLLRDRSKATRKRKNSKYSKISRGIGRAMMNTDLLNISDGEYENLALSLGIDINNKTIDQIKAEVQLLIGSEERDILKRQEKLAKVQQKLKDSPDSKRLRRKFQDLSENLKAREKSSTLNALLKEKNTLAQDYSDKIPVITLNESGKIASEAILKAVPVVVVGTTAGGRIQSKEEAAEARDNTLFTNKQKNLESFRAKLFANRDAETTDNNFLVSGKVNRKAVFKSEMAEGLKEIFNLEEQQINQAGKELKELALKNINITNNITKQYNSQLNSQINNQASNLSGLLFAAVLSEIDKIAKNNKDDTPVVKKIGRKLTDDDRSTAKSIIATRKGLREDGVKNHKIFISSEMGKFSKLAAKYFSESIITPEIIDGEHVIHPVLDLNKSHDVVIDIGKHTKDMSASLKTIASEVTGLKNVTAGLQSVGSAVNTVAATSALQLAIDALKAAARAGVEGPLMVKNDSGGTLKARTSNLNTRLKSNNVSNIITGDHPQNKNNTEMVSVDWASKQIKVKPLNRETLTTKSQKLQNSNLSSKRELSTADRNSPLSVGIQTGLVYYKKSLSDVTDDGSGTAIKVYSVNSSLNEKIRVGDTEMSLFDLLYGIYSSVPAIAAAITSSNQILATISSNTARTASNISKISSNSSSGSGFSFPTNLDSILEGV